MSRDIKYIGMDVHKEATVIAGSGSARFPQIIAAALGLFHFRNKVA